MNLYQGKTKFNLVTGVDTYTETNTDSMIKPIIQNGKLVGAITNVLVQDPKQGYAVFADIMIKEMREGE